jgi:tripartite-type tricarboxylate transporter receptor subunit TctC
MLVALCLALVAGTLDAWQTCAFAQVFQSRQVRIIVPFAPGAAVDVVARIIANGLAAQWGNPVIVENRAGGSTVTAAEVVARSDPDGQTLLFTVDDTFTVVPHLSRHLSFDPMKDLLPINLVAKILMVMVVNPAVPADSLPALIAYGRTNPRGLNYSSSGLGSMIHLAMEMLKSSAKVDILHVPYRGIAPALTAVAAGETQITISGYGTARGLIEARRVRPLVIASPERVAALPNVPTTGEFGYDSVDATSWLGLAAPAKTPSETINRINESVSRVLHDPEIRTQLIDARDLVVTDIGPTGFAGQIARKFKSMAEAVRVSGAKGD